jgi:hypothetical protein
MMQRTSTRRAPWLAVGLLLLCGWGGFASEPPADVARFLERLREKDAETRVDALLDLQALKGDISPARGAIVACLQDPSLRVRIAAAATLLLRIDPDNQPALRVLKEGLLDETNRGFARNQASTVGKTRPTVVPVLVSVATDKKVDAFVRMTALSGLQFIGPPAAKAVPALIGCLAEDYPVGGTAARALAEMGEAGKAAIPELAKRVAGDKEERLVDLNSYEMACALIKLEPENPTAAKHILKLLRNQRNGEARIHGASAYLSCKTIPEEVRAELKKRAEEDSNGTVRRLAREALNK